VGIEEVEGSATADEIEEEGGEEEDHREGDTGGKNEVIEEAKEGKFVKEEEEYRDRGEVDGAIQGEGRAEKGGEEVGVLIKAGHSEDSAIVAFRKKGSQGVFDAGVEE
jgi:hypothetical protein